MIAVSAMFAFVMYWVVWKMNTRAQERKRTEFENWDPEEKERKERDEYESSSHDDAHHERAEEE